MLQFGQVGSSSPSIRKLHLHNSGNAPAVISKVSTSCGCTTARPVSNTIKAKDEITVDVTLSSGQRTGKITKSILFEFEGASDPLVVPVEADVIRDFWIEPSVLYLSDDPALKRSPSHLLIHSRWADLTVNVECHDTNARVVSTSHRMVNEDSIIDVALDVNSAADGTTILVTPRNHSSNSIGVPVVYSKLTTSANSKVQPSRIAVGTVKRGTITRFKIFGHPEVLTQLHAVVHSQRIIAKVESVPTIGDSPFREFGVALQNKSPNGPFRTAIEFEDRKTGSKLHTLEVYGDVVE